MNRVRPTAVDGLFYPHNPEACRREVKTFIANAPAIDVRPKALIAPHAGYRYSGPIAGTAYRTLQAYSTSWDRVVLISPSHTMGFYGVAAPTWEAFGTTSGPISVDQNAIEQLTSLHLVHQDDAPHDQEHGLEVHLPFVQHLFTSISIIPLVTGEVSPSKLAGMLAKLLETPRTLPIISSDLSHYYPYSEAQTLDSETATYIEQGLGERLREEHACGRLALQGLLELAGTEKWHAETLDLRNSGDTAGSRDQVVGYGAFAFA